MQKSPGIRGIDYAWLVIGAALVGLTVSALVWLFNQAFNGIDNLMFNGLGGVLAPYGRWTIALIPAIGGLIVALIMRFNQPEKLAGMAHLIDGVAEHEGKLNDRNGLIFILASMVGIGFGAPVGADTPSAMIGGHLVSALAKRFRFRQELVLPLLVSAVAAGIAATYFAQFSAIFFALEIVLGGFGGALFVVPVLVSVGASALFTFLVTGLWNPYPPVPVVYHVNWATLFYLLLALLVSLAAIAYVRLLPGMKKFFMGLKIPAWLKPAVAGLVVGVVGIWVPGIFGTGLSQMKQIFSGTTFTLSMLIALMLCRLILTPSSLGSGFAGGVIGPALAIGSALGLAFGQVVTFFFPDLGFSPLSFAMVATAVMLAATFHAPLFGAMMILEMTSSYQLLVPIFVCAAIGYVIARRFQPGSAYTFGLHGQGIFLEPGKFTVIDHDNHS